MAAQPDPVHGGAAGRRGRWVLHALAGAVVALGIAAQLIRPLAPELGPPPAPSTAFDAAFLERAQAYRQPLYLALVVSLLMRIAIAAAVAFTGTGRALVTRTVARVGSDRPARAAAVVVVGVIVATDLVLMPLVFWARYIHDGNYGLRTQGVSGWLYDWVVYHVPVWTGVAVLVLLGYTLARHRPATWAPLGGVVAAVLGAAVAFASPLVLEPLSYRFTPLEAGDVRTEVESVLAAAGEDVDAIAVADASRRSIHQNAYISGFGRSERVVLFDTLVTERPAAEVGLVLAHELAHRRHYDVLRAVLLGASGVVVAAYVLWLVVARRARLGRQRGITDPHAAGVVLLVAVLLNVASTPLQSWVSRRAEAAADFVSLELTGAPEAFSAMQRGLAITNLSDPSPPKAVTLWHGSHPSTMARLGMAREWQQQ